jgi:hypothetical protein
MRKRYTFVALAIVGVLGASLFAAPAAAQPPGPMAQPQVVLDGNVASVSWAAPQSGGPVGAYLINAAFNGAVVPGSPFNVGTMTSISVGPLGAGTYSISITASNAAGSSTSPTTTFTIVGGAAPGTPTLAVPIISGNTVSFLWSGVPNATGYELYVVIQASGQVLTLPVGNQTSFVATLVPPGSYVVSVRATNIYGASAWSASQTAVVAGLSLPGTPTLFQPTVNGSTVTMNWLPPASGGAPTSYEIEAYIQATGQIVTVPVPASQTTVSVPGVPAGNFIVRIRARNVLGAGPWSSQQIVVVGITLISGELQVTLIWNTDADMDLHVREPDGTHVYFANKTGTSAFLDHDVIPGPGQPGGPEHIYVQSGAALAGTYQFYIVQYGRQVQTTSTIAVTLYPGTSNERTAIFTRTTAGANPGLGYNVANVDIGAGTIAETTGTRASDERAAGDVKTAKVP